MVSDAVDRVEEGEIGFGAGEVPRSILRSQGPPQGAAQPSFKEASSHRRGPPGNLSKTQPPVTPPHSVASIGRSRPVPVQIREDLRRDAFQCLGSIRRDGITKPQNRREGSSSQKRGVKRMEEENQF